MTGLTAGDALTAAGISVADVRRELPSVEPFAVTIRSASPLFQRFWARGVVAVAMPWGVYVRPPVFDRLIAASEPGRDGPLVVHELTHIEQYRRLGPVRHVSQYLSDYLGGRRRGLGHWEAYRQIRLEIEARQVAAGFESGQVPR